MCIIVQGLPKPDYTFTWTPTSTTLFRFSALIFNAHLVHLDKCYSLVEEGYPGLSVPAARLTVLNLVGRASSSWTPYCAYAHRGARLLWDAGGASYSYLLISSAKSKLR